jgi:hypothetical protein
MAAMTSKEIFQPRAVRQIMHPEFGRVSIYCRHDRFMGACLFHDTGFITPNFPKIGYAIDFQVDGEKLILFNRLEAHASHFKTGHVLEKRDGFNILFYLYDGRIIPKTRLNPKAGGKVIGIIGHEAFKPYMEKIAKMVNNGYIPVFEVWGRLLEALDIDHGSIDYGLVAEKRGLNKQLNVELLAVIVADYEGYNYTFVPAEEMVSLAEEYGLPTAPNYGKMDMTAINVLKIMGKLHLQNHRAGGRVIEGCVIHCYDGGHQMFKIKTYPIMKGDVVFSKTIPEERILLELTKILLENDVITIAKDAGTYLKQLREYIEEDYGEITNREEQKIVDVFREKMAKEVLDIRPDMTPEKAGREGFHKVIIGGIARKRAQGDKGARDVS